MDWNKITKHISKTDETARQMGDLANKGKKGLDIWKDASKILKGDGDILSKGSRLASLSRSAFSSEQDNIEKPRETAIVSDENEVCTVDAKEEAFVPTVDRQTDTVEIKSGDESKDIPLPTNISSSSDAVSALAQMGTEIAKAIQVCQLEETKRTEIKARADVEITRINAISKLLSDYLDKTFDERSCLFNEYFNVLDKAMESGNSELMAATLGSINSLAAQSPFRDLADLSSVQKQLSRADTEWDI